MPGLRIVTTLALCVVLLGPAPAAAQEPPLVLVLESSEHAEAAVSESFLAALRIELTGVARVEPGPALRGRGLAAELERATEIVRTAGAALAVWTQPPARAQGESVTTLYVVGQERDLALVRVARVAGERGPALDRALALTVAELLDAVLSARPGPAPEPAVVRSFARPPRRPAPAPEPTWQVGLELGGALLVDPTAGVTGAVRGALWLAFVDEVRLELGPVAQLSSRLGRSLDGAHAEVEELHLRLGARVSAALDPHLRLGGFAELGARVLGVRGSSAGGLGGSAERVVPALWIGADGRWTPAPSITIRLDLGLEVSASTERFTVEGRPLLELSPVRPTGGVSVILWAG